MTTTHLTPAIVTETSASAAADGPATAGRSAAPSRRALWAGRILSGLGVAFLLFDATIKIVQPPGAFEATSNLGWSMEKMLPLGILQVVCLAIYLLPRTAVLGAVLWTGYLGGAIATHVRVDNPLFSHTLFPTYVAALLWGGLWLRDVRVRALLPFRA